MSRVELKVNRSYQIKYYVNYHCVERYATKEVIENLLNQKQLVEVYKDFNYELVK